ncbi:MAG: YdeI/OmpD-associated family protein, partial [Bacteroidota bacterium]
MDHEHAFLAPILLPQGGMYQHRLPLPEDIADDFRERNTRRVLGTLNGEPFDLALHRSKQDGFLFIGVSKGRMRSLGVAPGDLVEVEMSADPDPNHVEPGAELGAALDADAEAREAWDALSPGLKRSVAWQVRSAKREATRLSRAQEAAKRLAEGT